MSAVSFTTFSLLSQMFLTVILVQQNLLDSDVEMLSQSRGYESSVVAAVSDDSLYIRMAFAHQECQGSQGGALDTKGGGASAPAGGNTTVRAWYTLTY